jgi:hypothetical protein
MSNEISIFKQPGAISTSANRGQLSELAKTLAGATSGGTSRRIQTNTNGTFKRLVNGEQIGDAVRGDIDVIIVHALPKVSRVFYAGAYDPNAKPTLPDCWSNNGDIPEAAAGNKQGLNCVSCPKNVVGSGSNGKGRACRYQRRVAVILPTDSTGEVYQFNVPAKSLFGKGVGNVHPFESYVRYLLANHESPDAVVTNISYDLNADSMELLFTPVRGINPEEWELVKLAQADAGTKRMCELTVAAQDGVKKQTAAPAPQIARSDEPDEEAPAVIAEPTKRPAAKSDTNSEPKANLAAVISNWGSDEDD